mmetsp:Transcript_91541/g.158696  ORF Transcript_91541/g.158696 Transcript_91541/m.158696 type:complete len:325 (-) Transcript_91541:20-994(-)
MCLGLVCPVSFGWFVLFRGQLGGMPRGGSPPNTQRLGAEVGWLVGCGGVTAHGRQRSRRTSDGRRLGVGLHVQQTKRSARTDASVEGGHARPQQVAEGQHCEGIVLSDETLGAFDLLLPHEGLNGVHQPFLRGGHAQAHQVLFDLAPDPPTQPLAVSLLGLPAAVADHRLPHLEEGHVLGQQDVLGGQCPIDLVPGGGRPFGAARGLVRHPHWWLFLVLLRLHWLRWCLCFGGSRLLAACCAASLAILGGRLRGHGLRGLNPGEEDLLDGVLLEVLHHLPRPVLLHQHVRKARPGTRLVEELHQVPPLMAFGGPDGPPDAVATA